MPLNDNDVLFPFPMFICVNCGTVIYGVEKFTLESKCSSCGKLVLIKEGK
jgi:DNA-directed RNA polymerase subunit RPC12/RpoP